MSPPIWQFLADTVLFAHVGLALFVVLGLPLIIVGNLRRWRWVNAPWLRLAHLATILVVAAEAWAGFVCPLTTLEMTLRAKASEPTYAGSLVEHWLQALLFWQAPAWVFAAVYTLFGTAVVATWLVWPVRLQKPGATVLP